jgi:E3 ubiquitin-protein ligase DOA10
MDKDKEFCYICFEEKSIENPFSESVCVCKGTINIHSTCLQELLEHNIKKCTICKTDYKTPKLYRDSLELIMYYDNYYERKYMYTITKNGRKKGLYQEWHKNG